MSNSDQGRGLGRGVELSPARQIQMPEQGDELTMAIESSVAAARRSSHGMPSDVIVGMREESRHRLDIALKRRNDLREQMAQGIDRINTAYRVAEEKGNREIERLEKAISDIKAKMQSLEIKSDKMAEDVRSSLSAEIEVQGRIIYTLENQLISLTDIA